MKRWLLVLAACGGSDPPNSFDLAYDAVSTCPVVAACSLLTQTGCNAGEKCAWVESYDPCVAPGSIACAPNGSATLGDVCTTLAAEQGGYDNCVAGAVCHEGRCEQICDNNGGAPTCPSGAACMSYDGLFARPGSSTTPAGACTPTCDPLADNDFDGSGTRFTKSGSACGKDPTVGCYGMPSHTHNTFFTCATPAPGTEQLTHRSVLPSLPSTFAVCMPGYELGAFYADDTGAQTLVCLAWCKPGDAYQGNPLPNAPNGVAPHRCNTDDALGAFGTPASDTVNGEHCMYSWIFEIDDTNAFHRSPTSDTLGICIDHTKYTDDPTGTGSGAPVPPCAQLPLAQAAAAGCVSTALAMPMFHRPRRFRSLPELR